MFVHHHAPARLSQFQLGAHLLNLSGLFFYRCRETRNGVFQFRDPLLLLLEFIDCRLVLRALRIAHSQFLPTRVDQHRAQVTVGIDVHGESGTGINGRSEDAADKRHFVIGSAGGNAADRNHIGVAGKTGVADIDIVADDTWIGARCSADGRVVIASAILKCRAAYCRVVASVGVGLQRERAHSGVVDTVVIINQGGCSKGAVPRAGGVEQ